MPSNDTPGNIGGTGVLGSVSNFSGGDPQSGLNPWDTSDPFISHTTRILMQRVLKCYVRQAIVFVGIPGNLLCCLVFFKQGLSDKINLLLFWLAVVDLSSLLSQLLLMPRCYLTDKIQVSNWAVIDNIKTSYVGWWLGHLSGILIVVVSVHRCLSVALPLKAKRLLGYRWTTDPSTNRSIAYSDQTTWFPIDMTQANEIVHNFLVVALPVFLSIMVLCCTITIVHLRQASRQRLKMTGTVTEDARAGHNRITVMLLVICGVYTFLVLPELIFSIVVMLVPGGSSSEILQGGSTLHPAIRAENSHFVHSEKEGLCASSSRISSRSPVRLSQAVVGRISSCSPVRLSQAVVGRISSCSPVRLSQAVAGRISPRSLVRLQSSGSKRQNLSSSDNISVDDHSFTEPVDCAMDSTLPSTSGSIAADMWK
ncbi:hypothetical protein ACOMHN_010446 [Nucella lapillus]